MGIASANSSLQENTPKKSCLLLLCLFQDKAPKFADEIGGGFKYLLFSPRNLGKMNPVWLIFFNWVGSTTNQFDIRIRLPT